MNAVPLSAPPLPDFEVGLALEQLLAVRGSDLHLKAGNRPLARIDGRLQPLDPAALPLTPMDTERTLHDILPGARTQQFEAEHELDFPYSVPGLGRFRVNAYIQRGSVAIVLRAIPSSVHSIEDLGLPPVVGELADVERGIILVTGTTGSGKSTTLAALIDQINRTMCKKIVTIEDPIEFLHTDDQSSIDQREVGSDTLSFERALRRVLRQDPDVILIGEIRDETSARTALSAAETGHLVLSTVHTLDAAETVNRMIDFFPPHEHRHARTVLANTLRGIIAQRLAPAASGPGRVPICEILTMTGRVHDMILDPARTDTLPDAMTEGAFYGMQTFDQGLFSAVRAERITVADSMRLATSPQDLKLMLYAAGTEVDLVPAAAG